MVSGYAVDCFLEKMFGIQRPGRFLPKYSRPKPSATAPLAVQEKKEASSIVIDGVEWKNLDHVTKDPEYEQNFSSHYAIQAEADLSPLTLSEVSRQLSHAATRDDVAKAALEFLSCSRQIAALLIIKEMTAQGWSAISGRKKLTGFKEAQFAIAKLPDLYQCVSNQKPFLGDTDTAETRLLLKSLNHEECSLGYFPISIQQHVVAVLICDRSDGFNAAEVTELSRKISYALSILILKSKLLR